MSEEMECFDLAKIESFRMIGNEGKHQVYASAPGDDGSVFVIRTFPTFGEAKDFLHLVRRYLSGYKGHSAAYKRKLVEMGILYA